LVWSLEDDVMQTTSACCRLEVVPLLLGVLTGAFGFAAAPSPMHHAAQAPGIASNPQSVPENPAVEAHIKNRPTSRIIHPVDFQATTGPGAGRS
jgi:hypothetical protein